MYIRALNFSCLIIFISSILICCAGTREERARIQEDMGRSLLLEGKPREGLVHLLEAKKINPSNPEIHHQLALAYQKIGEYDLSLKHFQKAIHLNPKYSEAYNNMGILYSQQKEWSKALDCFEKAIGNLLYSTPHFAYHNIGSVHFHNGDFSKAIENYEKAIKLDPSYIAAYKDLAALYLSIDEQKKALATYRKAAAIAPQSWVIQLSLSHLYLKMGMRQEAIKQLNHIISTDPRNQYAKEAMRLMETIRLSE